MTTAPIRPRDRDTVVQALRAGVAPLRGQHLIQVGRHREIESLLRDVERVGQGGSGLRLVIGAYGSGKTFFLGLVRSIALERKLVTAHGDLTPERRLYSTGGHARSLYAELMRNLATRAKPEGGALPAIVERFVTTALTSAKERSVDPSVVIRENMASLSEMVGGYDFAQVIECYWRGHDTGDEQLKANAVRWLRAEFATKTEARQALGVRTIIDDASFYDHLKLFARFVRMAGFGGLVVCIDELVNLYKMANTTARNTNYEQILRILNDSLQGTSEGLGFLLGGTPEFLTDTRRGLYSYQALQSRLAENAFASDGRVDLSGPVLRLASLTPEDLYVLLVKLRHLYACGEVSRYLVPDSALTAFLQHCSQRIGEAYFRTPRNTIKEFLHLLAVLEQNPGTVWESLFDHVNLDEESNPDLAPLPEDAEQADEPAAPPPATTRARPAASDDDDLASFKL